MQLTQKLLQSINIFSQLTTKELESLQKISSLKSLCNNEILFYEGESSEQLNIIVEGIIQVYKINRSNKEIILKEFTPFSFVAELSNYNHICFPASAKSIGNSSVLQIDFEKFEKQFLYHPNISPSIIKSMANKIMILEQTIAMNLTMDATQRVAKMIYDKHRYLESNKHHKLATELNITPVTFSRILRKFKDENIIDSDNKIINKDLLKLQFS